ncbi:MAG: copper chaperone PCu(A)C [Ignavibacteriaceae bacterium]
MFLLTFLLLFISSPKEKIYIENEWIRSANKGMNTAFYFDVKNDSDKPDTLYKVASDLSEIIQMHETYSNGDMMGMREVKNIVIDPHSTFNFKPGSHHVMLIKLKKNLKDKQTGEITLYFKNAGELKVKAPIKNSIK